MAVVKNIVFLLNGVELGEEAITKFSYKGSTEIEDATTVGASGYRSKVTGFKSGSVDATGIFDSDATTENKIDDLFMGAWQSGAVNYILTSKAAPAVGGGARLSEGSAMEYKIPHNTGVLIFSEAMFESNIGVRAGKFLMHAAQASGTNNGTGVDHGAATTNGLYGQVHLENDDATDVDTKIQHSTDGSTWADLTGAVVSNLSAANAAGSFTVAAGVTINAHLRAVCTVSGGDTTLVSVAVARG